MSDIKVGYTNKYAENWGNIFLINPKRKVLKAKRIDSEPGNRYRCTNCGSKCIERICHVCGHKTKLVLRGLYA